MTATQDIVAKLWGLCHVLRDDGVTYSEYVTELTYLLFLKMMEETGGEARIPASFRWRELAKREGLEQLTHYRQALTSLGDPKIATDPTVQAIFTDAQTRLRKPANLKSLTTAIDGLDWFDARTEGLGDLYEGLLQKNAEDKKSGAGQYFTPRPLIDCLVRLMQPKLGEIIQDPAAGTGGFIVAAHHRICADNGDLFGLAEGVAARQLRDCYQLAELVPDTHRLCLMNLMLHGIEGHACERALQFEFTATPKDDGADFAGQTLRIFAIGHALEDLAIRWLRAAGLDLYTRKADGGQFGFAVAGGRVRGHVDGIIAAAPAALGLRVPALWECKTMNAKNWRETVAKGVAVAKPVYAAQIALYQAYMEATVPGVSAAPALFTAINKDTAELHHELVPFDAELAQRMSDRAVRILRATDAGELLPRIAATRDFLECRFCPWAERCWSLRA